MFLLYLDRFYTLLFVNSCKAPCTFIFSNLSSSINNKYIINFYRKQTRKSNISNVKKS